MSRKKATLPLMIYNKVIQVVPLKGITVYLISSSLIKERLPTGKDR